jgi:hypothetical protein
MCGKLTYIVLNINVQSCVNGESTAIHGIEGSTFMYLDIRIKFITWRDCTNTCQWRTC